MSRTKELNFFLDEYNWRKGERWYRRSFEGNARIFGESSPLYSNCIQYKEVPVRMQALIPDAKIIYLVRDPIERILSHYIHTCFLGMEKRSIQDALKCRDDSNPYIASSKYHMQLKQYLEYFPLSSILLLATEDLFQQRRDSLRQVFRFLGIEESFTSSRFEVLKNTVEDINHKSHLARFLKKMTDRNVIKLIPESWRNAGTKLIFSTFTQRILKPELGEQLKNELSQVFKQDMQQLREMTGLQFSDWSI